MTTARTFEFIEIHVRSNIKNLPRSLPTVTKKIVRRPAQTGRAIQWLPIRTSSTEELRPNPSHSGGLCPLR